MADEKQVYRLQQGVEAWNTWRKRNPNVRLDFASAFLRGTDLGGVLSEDLGNTFRHGVWVGGADLRGADLRRADLLFANLRGAVFDGADLRGADLSRANLEKVVFKGADLSRAVFDRANLERAYLQNVNLIMANLEGANLSRADLFKADLLLANLRGAVFEGADLIRVNLSRANLEGANLKGANLSRAVFEGANLEGANFNGATLAETVFGNTILRGAKELELCKHDAPSIIDYRTLQQSGTLPLIFLRGCGLPDNFIDHLPSFLNHPIQFYSCFISYSSRDEDFAQRLFADLQNKGVRCWFAPHDMKIGTKILDALDEAIHLRDKVLLLLSEHSIASGWVEGEVTRALDEERTRQQTILFPVRLDNAVLETPRAWVRLLRGQRHIGDFCGWKDHDAYQKSLERLLHDLKVER